MFEHSNLANILVNKKNIYCTKKFTMPNSTSYYCKVTIHHFSSQPLDFSLQVQCMLHEVSEPFVQYTFHLSIIFNFVLHSQYTVRLGWRKKMHPNKHCISHPTQHVCFVRGCNTLGWEVWRNVHSWSSPIDRSIGRRNCQGSCTPQPPFPSSFPICKPSPFSSGQLLPWTSQKACFRIPLCRNYEH